MDRRGLGIYGEAVARSYLQKKGYRIIEVNFRCTAGEIDVVARHKKDLVFVEVRTKSSEEFGTPEESVTFAKKEKLIGCALHYLMLHNEEASSWRVDFVGVELEPNGKPKRVEIIENVLE